MKKLLYLLIALPLFLTSCHDDNDLPKFNVQVVIGEGAKVDDGVITVEQGTPLVIESVSPVNSNASSIAFGTVTYILDYGVGISNNIAPFGVVLETGNLSVGRHLLQITFPVFAVDYSVCQAVVTYELVITEPAGDGDEGSGETPAGGTQVVSPNVTSSN